MMTLDLNLNIETNRLILRPFMMGDITPAYEMDADEAVNRYTGESGKVTKKEVERRIVENVMGEYKKYGYGRLAVTLKSNGQFIGFAGLKYLPNLKAVDIGYRLIPEYWGKGYATEASKACVKFAFETLNLTKIIAMVMPENKGSVRVLEKLGFTYEKEILDEGDLVWLYSLSSN
jgi:ribosomal-protein-alanine N-acetyltransferase